MNVERTDAERVGGHEAADVREDCDQRRLPHVRRLAAHVRARHDEQALRGIQGNVVCDERRVDNLFNDEMASTCDLDARCCCYFRFAEVQRNGAFGETAEYIQFRERGSGQPER